jgi:predicted nuclease of predicted toxin-antitoxin system
MKFLADQNFPRTCAPLLAEFDHELAPTRFDPQSSLSDNWIFDLAQSLGAVLLTTDKDFFHTIRWLYSEHQGAIIITLKRPSRVAILNKLRAGMEFIKTHPIENHVLLLTDTRVYFLRRNKGSK